MKDEYSESDLEQALIDKLEDFLLELGSEFAFVGRQKRLRNTKRLSSLPAPCYIYGYPKRRIS
ncbi:PDDEXK nuclease domain-containing protein [Halotia wernerae UHCC 0503]|nr:PDDEXK nuclease domain-containing protein [Halotia wernerae UHCC 0503]